jgi:ABC-type oligopeptide transport system ATPase subunit
MFYGMINEGYLLSEKDVKYQVEEFESGKIKTLFITGQSGSGKSTLGRKYAEELKIPIYGLDEVIDNYKYTDEQLKEIGQDLYEYFQSDGSDFRINKKSEVRVPLVNSKKFIEFILKRNSRCIVEGIHIFLLFSEDMLNIDQLKNSAIIIKGTSGLKSTYRSVKRDYESDKKEDPNIKITDALNFNYLKSKIQDMIKDEKNIKSLRKKVKSLENK